MAAAAAIAIWALGTNQVEDRQVAQVPVAKKTSLEAAPVDGLAQQKPASTAAGAESAGGRSATTKGPAAASFGGARRTVAVAVGQTANSQVGAGGNVERRRRGAQRGRPGGRRLGAFNFVAATLGARDGFDGAMQSMRAARKATGLADEPPLFIYQVSANYLRDRRFEKLLEAHKVAPAAGETDEKLPAGPYYRLVISNAAAADQTQLPLRREYIIRAPSAEVESLVNALAKQRPTCNASPAARRRQPTAKVASPNLVPATSPSNRRGRLSFG